LTIHNLFVGLRPEGLSPALNPPLLPPIALNPLVVLPVKMASVPFQLTLEKPTMLPEAKVILLILSLSRVTKLPRSMENDPVAPFVLPKKAKVMVDKVGVMSANVYEPDTPEPTLQAAGGPTQKPALLGSVYVPKGVLVIVMPPVVEVLNR